MGRSTVQSNFSTTESFESVADHTGQWGFRQLYRIYIYLKDSNVKYYALYLMCLNYLYLVLLLVSIRFWVYTRLATFGTPQ